MLSLLSTTSISPSLYSTLFQTDPVLNKPVLRRCLDKYDLNSSSSNKASVSARLICGYIIKLNLATRHDVIVTKNINFDWIISKLNGSESWFQAFRQGYQFSNISKSGPQTLSMEISLSLQEQNSPSILIKEIKSCLLNLKALSGFLVQNLKNIRIAKDKLFIDAETETDAEAQINKQNSKEENEVQQWNMTVRSEYVMDFINRVINKICFIFQDILIDIFDFNTKKSILIPMSSSFATTNTNITKLNNENSIGNENDGLPSQNTSKQLNTLLNFSKVISGIRQESLQLKQNQARLQLIHNDLLQSKTETCEKQLKDTQNAYLKSKGDVQKLKMQSGSKVPEVWQKAIREVQDDYERKFESLQKKLNDIMNNNNKTSDIISWRDTQYSILSQFVKDMRTNTPEIEKEITDKKQEIIVLQEKSKEMVADAEKTYNILLQRYVKDDSFQRAFIRWIYNLLNIIESTWSDTIYKDWKKLQQQEDNSNTNTNDVDTDALIQSNQPSKTQQIQEYLTSIMEDLSDTIGLTIQMNTPDLILPFKKLLNEESYNGSFLI